MKFSEQWLREWVDPPVSTEDLAEQLTMAGLEVEGIEDCRRQLAGIVIACVTETTRHPAVEKLTVCKIDAGAGAPLTVVCGAPNVQPGTNYALAPAGTTLADGTAIRTALIKGVESAGMLCSGWELGLSDAAGSLMEFAPGVAPGTPLQALLGLDDKVIELSLTPNRGDCLSIAGIAREVGVLYRRDVKGTDIRPVPAVTDAGRGIFLDAPEACARYAGRIIEGIDSKAGTPVWMCEKLRRSGIRSINAIVDITNFVMLELGQPMHAFDHDSLAGDIHVRYAAAGEQLTLLDGTRRSLNPRSLVIADDGRAVALAGIMGGLDTAVTDHTRNVFLESAFFAAEVILGRARDYGLHTDSSHRFERGVDYELQVPAMERATGLLMDICGGTPGPVRVAGSRQHLPERPTVRLRHDRLTRVLGMMIDRADVTDILRRLQLDVRETDGAWEVMVAPFRFDIRVEADLIEEIIRIHGYHRVPVAPLKPAHIQSAERAAPLTDLRQVLQQRGYQEVITYSFVERAQQQRILGRDDAIRLLNPISSALGVMRQTLLASLLSTLQYNLKRQQQRVRIFELGRIYHKNQGISQDPVIAGLCHGYLYPEQWDIKDNTCGFFDIKGDIEALLRVLGPEITPEYRVMQHPALHPRRSAEITLNNQPIGILGAIHPAIQKDLDIIQTVYVFELKLAAFSTKLTPIYRKLSKFPSIRRDLSIVLDRQIPVAEVLKCARCAATELLKNLELFDLYIGEGIDIEKKSLALGLTFQGTSSTLMDKEVDDLVSCILHALQSQFGATLRE